MVPYDEPESVGDLQGLAAGDDAGLTPRDSLANYRTGAQEEPFPEAFPKKSGALKAELPESVPLGAPRKWTVLAYISGDNNLEGPEVHSLLQLEKIGSNEDVHVVAQLDRREIPDDYSQYRLGVDGDWSGARRYYITKGAQEPSDVKYHLENAEPYAEIQFKVKTIQSPVVQDLGEVDIADKKTFKDFLTWGMKSFPAEHYLVVMMDHGYGYMGTMHDVSPGNLMTLPEMRQGLEEAEKETGRKVDILGLDCCLMGLAETAYELKDAASVVIASQQFEIVPGWPIAQILTNLQTGSKDKAMPVRDVAKMIVGESAKTPFS
ncbi:MAG: hypothetical protein HYU64_04415, partial [Armatimonadetes bacterium]|nr:hypothetical protein [Armatimonadota bacterium]